MKFLITIGIAAIVSTSSVHAAGFQPWHDAGTAEQPDAKQATVRIQSWYRTDAVIQDFAQEPQADVTVTSWYAASRV